MNVAQVVADFREELKLGIPMETMMGGCGMLALMPGPLHARCKCKARAKNGVSPSFRPIQSL